MAAGAHDGHTFEITGMVEKPRPGNAPSNLFIAGRYILQPEIFQALELLEKGAGGEMQLTDGMIQLARAQKFHGVRFDGSTYDCGWRPASSPPTSPSPSAATHLAPGLKEELRNFDSRPRRSDRPGRGGSLRPARYVASAAWCL